MQNDPSIKDSISKKKAKKEERINRRKANKLKLSQDHGSHIRLILTENLENPLMALQPAPLSSAHFALKTEVIIFNLCIVQSMLWKKIKLTSLA